MNAKIKISLDDPEVRKVWNAVLEARREVASWPAWKRGEEVAVATTSSTDGGGAATPASGPKR